jgi:hypothetical protein
MPGRFPAQLPPKGWETNMPDPDELAAPAGRGRKLRSPDPAVSGSRSKSVRPGDRFAFELDATTGAIIKCEIIDAAGMRRELSEDDRANLAKSKMQGRLEGLLERAFEAGVASVLGARGETEDPQETEEETELRRLLLEPLLAQSIVAHLVRRHILGSAILETLIQYSIHPAHSETDEKPTTPGGGA